jgi:FAD dependent oxidoreductase TIGR03364
MGIGLRGSLFSSDEMIVDPREAISKISLWLAEKYNVQFLWGKVVTGIACPRIFCGDEVFEGDMIWVCNGADFETLYPGIFSSLPLTKCKLQMMRFAPQPANWRIGPALCGALSLAHYQSFSAAPSLGALKQRFELELAEYMRLGIHVMVAQNEYGELTVGDSHEYGMSPDPFDRHEINRLITGYLETFAVFRDNEIVETWNGVYAKLKDGGTEIVNSPEPGVTIVNGLGGAGMTLSLGLCEEVVGRLCP